MRAADCGKLPGSVDGMRSFICADDIDDILHPQPKDGQLEYEETTFFGALKLPGTDVDDVIR